MLGESVVELWYYGWDKRPHWPHQKGLIPLSKGPFADGPVFCWEFLSHVGGRGVCLNSGLSWAVDAGTSFPLTLLWSSLFVGYSGILVSAVATESTSLLLIQYDMPALCYRDSEQWGTPPLVSEELSWDNFHLSLFLSPFSLWLDLPDPHSPSSGVRIWQLCSLLPQACQGEVQCLYVVILPSHPFKRTFTKHIFKKKCKHNFNEHLSCAMQYLSFADKRVAFLLGYIQ